VMIGAMLAPPWSEIALGIVLTFVLFAVRLPAVRLATLGARLSTGDRMLIDVSMPRGMAAGVLATLPMASGVVATSQLPVIVFTCIVATICVFAAGMPFAARRAERERRDAESIAAAPGGEAAAVPDQVAEGSSASTVSPSAMIAPGSQNPIG